MDLTSICGILNYDFLANYISVSTARPNFTVQLKMSESHDHFRIE